MVFDELRSDLSGAYIRNIVLLDEKVDAQK